MSAEKIIEQIKKDTAKEINQINLEAEKQIKNIIQSAKKEAEIQAEKIVEQGKQQSEMQKKIQLSKANQDIKREIMNTKEKIIENCFTKAHHELCILKGERYEKLIKKFIFDGQNKLGKDCTVLYTRPVDKKIVTDMGLKVEGAIDSSGGIILKSADGKVTLDHTFDGIIRRNKDKLRIMVGKLLFS
jgi:vacuolar-type H+-ATPase subunit E/Vma4